MSVNEAEKRQPLPLCPSDLKNQMKGAGEGEGSQSEFQERGDELF